MRKISVLLVAVLLCLGVLVYSHRSQVAAESVERWEYARIHPHGEFTYEGEGWNQEVVAASFRVYGRESFVISTTARGMEDNQIDALNELGSQGWEYIGEGMLRRRLP